MCSARSFERTDARLGHANGFKPKALTTRLGPITGRRCIVCGVLVSWTFDSVGSWSSILAHIKASIHIESGKWAVRIHDGDCGHARVMLGSTRRRLPCCVDRVLETRCCARHHEINRAERSYAQISLAEPVGFFIVVLMGSILNKIRGHLRRKALARRFGVAFSRRGTFSTPGSILLHGQKIDLCLPLDLGVKNDFLGCLLDDCYGLRQLPFEPKTILDIGANVGLFSMAAREFFPGAIIHAYEPNPRTLPYLEGNARVAKFSVFGEALGASDGKVQIADTGETNLARTQPINEQSSDGITQVSFRKAMERLGGAVDLLKLDCEGAEWDLFRAADCWANVRLLRMEYHLWKTHSFSELSNTLEALNFAILKHEPSEQCGLVWCERRAR